MSDNGNPRMIKPKATVQRDLWPEDVASLVMYHAMGAVDRYERFVARLYHELSSPIDGLTDRNIAKVFRALGIRVQGITDPLPEETKNG